MEKNRILKEKLEDSISKARKAISTLADSVQFSVNDDHRGHIVAAMAKTLLAPDRELNSTDVENFRMVWSKKFSIKEADDIVGELYNSTVITVDEAAEFLHDLPQDGNHELLCIFAELISSSDSPEQAEMYLRDLGRKLNFAEEDIQNIIEQAKGKSEKQKKLLRSGAGMLAALIILVIFILTATWLKSVIYGLLLAALMFPVEQYFERKFAAKKGLLYLFFRMCGRCETSIKKTFKRKNSNIRPTAAEIKKEEKELWIRNSVSMSCVVLVAAVVAISSFFWILSAGYFNSARNAVKNFLSSPAVEQTENDNNANASKKEIAVSTVTVKVQNALENGRRRFENTPIVREVLQELAQLLKNPDTQKEIAALLLKKTGGLLNLTTGIISALAVFALDILLTVFFYLLFLTKMAQFAQADNGRKQNYIVRTVFSGNWLPRADEENIQETESIINEIGHKLKVWLRGYLSLMFIDFTVYSIVFYFLNVPYFLILGAIAGCGILLPFIGPILSACLTCLVTLACGDASAMQICGIIISYLIHNGITEQFILYPAVIGESLGLTALETIIVVLLGGIFAGATGMILSIPTAAVIKYLVPRIYHCWHPNK